MLIVIGLLLIVAALLFVMYRLRTASTDDGEIL
jgi:hypothetical protein